MSGRLSIKGERFFMCCCSFLLVCGFCGAKETAAKGHSQTRGTKTVLEAVSSTEKMNSTDAKSKTTSTEKMNSTDAKSKTTSTEKINSTDAKSKITSTEKMNSTDAKSTGLDTGKVSNKKARNKNGESLASSKEAQITAAAKKKAIADLLTVLKNTLENNKQIKALEKELTSAELEKNVAASTMRPTVQASTGYRFSDTSQWASDDNNAFKNKNGGRFSTSRDGKIHGGVAVKQNLFHGGADVAHIENVDYSVQAKKSEIEATKQKILLDVASIYFKILSKKKEIQHLQAHIDATKSLLDVVSEREKTGEGRYAEVMEAQARLASAESKLANSQAEHKALVASIEESMGASLSENITPPQRLFDDSMGESQAFDIALKQNPAVIAAVDKLRAAKHNIKEQNRGIYPSVDLTYSYSQDINHMKDRPSNPLRDSSRGHTVSLDVAIPIYDGGVANTRRKQAIEAATKASIEKEKLFDDIRVGIVTMRANMEAARKGIESGDVAIKAQELALHDTEEEYKAGIKIITNVLDAQEKLFEARTLEVESRKNYLLAQCQMLSLLGMLNAKGLKFDGG
ncbi:MAG: TolC family protein [Holosporales bacterium]|jgi:outer membrane protein|nr:TolC family protein [Holosporales bacterium]